MLKIPVTPEMHAVEMHLVWQFELFKGLFDFREDWVELLHQLGLKDNKRSRGLRDRPTKFVAHANWEEMSNHPDVRQAKLEVEAKSKRIFKNPRRRDKESAPESRKRKRNEQRAQVAEAFQPQVHRTSLALNLAEFKRRNTSSDNTH